MARKNANQKKPKSASAIPLKQADRSGPDPSQETLLKIAEQRGLLNPENHKLKDGSLPKNAKRIRPEDEEEDIGRLGNAVLWSISMAALHFTFDVLTQHQYSETIVWPNIIKRALEAFLIILSLFYTLHPHPEPAIFVPNFPPLFIKLVFFAGSIVAGCYLINITNSYSYYAILKQAPPLGVLWIWCVTELDLSWIVWSVGVWLWYLKVNGFSIMGA